MDKDFGRIAKRAALLGLSEPEAVALLDPPMSYPTYWRAREGQTAKLVTRVRIARRLEALLDRLERERAEA